MVLQSMRWGVVPRFHKHDDGALKTINARGENLTDGTSGLWNGLKGRKRCIVVAQGYFEWLKKGPKERIPYFTKHKDGKLMLFAGLWDSVVLEGLLPSSLPLSSSHLCFILIGTSEPLYTFTIITTSATTELEFLHDRMPVVLSSEKDIKMWLGTAEIWSKELADIIKPSDAALES